MRNLVEFILREGSIDNRKGAGPDKDAMLMGGRIHRKIQRKMGAEYQAEVSLKIQIPCGDFLLQIEGRADGIIVKNGSDGKTEVTVDEIKGVLRDVSFIENPVNVHLAQAKCYAYIYALQHEIDEISVQMTYCNLDTEEIRRFLSSYTREELQKWFEDMKNGRGFRLRGRKRGTNLSQVSSFPFPTEKGSGMWRWQSTGLFRERRNCLSRRLQVWEKRFQPYFPQ